MTRTMKINDSYKYSMQQDDYNDAKKRRSLNNRIQRFIKSGVIEGDVEKGIVNVDSLMNFVELERRINEKYVPFKEFLAELNLSKSSSTSHVHMMLTKESASNIFDVIYTEKPVGLANTTLYISRESIEKFKEEYISLKEAINIVERLKDDSIRHWIIKKLDVKVTRIGAKVFYKKEEFAKIKNYEWMPQYVTPENSVPEGYYTPKQALKRLSYHDKGSRGKLILAEIEAAYDLKPIIYRSDWKAYSKDAVEELIIVQEKLKKEYVVAEEIMEICQPYLFHTYYVDRYPVDPLLRPIYPLKKTCYNRSQVEAWLEAKKNKNVFFNVALGDPYESFLYKMELKNVEINRLGDFTKGSWLKFVSQKLAISKANADSLNTLTTRLVYCTENLINFLDAGTPIEIYSVTSNDINLFFNSIAEKDAKHLYNYIKQVHNLVTNNDMVTFDINRVINPYLRSRSKQDKSIYEYATFKKIYEFANDIGKQKERAIKSSLSEIQNPTTRRKHTYLATSWLYVLMHLNNAWRHSDVMRFPRINLTGTGVISLEWLLENEINKQDIDFIIGQVYKTDFVISKTQVKNHFFVSEELKKSLATAIAICELRIQKIHPLSEIIMDFGPTVKEFSDARKRQYFETMEGNDFVFSSRKMNRTLLSYVYTILSKTTRGEVALKTVQKMRGHLEQETTNYYVDIPKEDFNFLTKQLFSRGSFGFVYDNLLDVVNGIELDRNTRTDQIHCLQQIVGSPQKVEEISGYLNVIQNDRKTVMDYILSLGLEGSLDLLNKIDVGLMPSKEDNVQCLFAETGCVKIGKGVSCFDCAFSIPNYYALSSLGATLQSKMNDYIGDEENGSEEPYFEKKKKARLFYITLEMFAQAIERFGLDVYEFIDDSREEFISKQSLIGSLGEKYQLKA